MSIFEISRLNSRHTKSLSKRMHIIAVLDVGSTKVVCLIGRLVPKKVTDLLPGRTHHIEIIGIGYQKSHGVKMGAIVDLIAIEGVIRQVVEVAERMAGITVDSLIVNVSCGRLGSTTHAVGMKMGWREVKTTDIQKLIENSRQNSCGQGRVVLHSMATNYSLDGKPDIKSPLAMFGENLGMDVHVVTVEQAAIKNLEIAVNRAHLSVEGMVATPYASGLAALVDDEFELGCAVIDMGGSTTTMAIFEAGKLVYVDSIAIGGCQVTNDLARGLSIRVDDAERLKVIHANVISSSADEHEILSIPSLGDDEQENPVQVSRAMISRIVRARVEETLELICERIQNSGFGSLFGRCIVLTGGASQLAGLQEMARRMLSSNVRMGRPMGISGLPLNAKGAAFSTAVGLMVYPQLATMEMDFAGSKKFCFPYGLKKTKVSLVERWLKKSF
ncbi:cell division protein FtsA [Candidatus Liberibacter sp.]|uniref:cell division protein FtsA n=1 Tax=Candidatus Liberibacter sp. TaxID=34022 RepID=UPI0015F39796|nr:cell division protein FtsA [Candidatus Liberibacter sp.]MBA5724289.1 cell division protein FtsA [Candidatus Liberibacter sp.]